VRGVGLAHGASGDRGHASALHTHDSRTDLRAHGPRSAAARVRSARPAPRRLRVRLLSDAKTADAERFASGSLSWWNWDVDGLSLHNYTVVKWPPAFKSVGFGEDEYAQILKTTLDMDDLIKKHSAIMDKYDPQKKVALVVDEWGGWYAPLPGSNPGFLVQQNSLRDAILAALNLNIFARHADRVRGANIAQMINVLQAMILTDHEKMSLTPTYYVYKMYVPFQDSTFVPVTFDAGSYKHGDFTLPRVDAMAAKSKDGKLWVEITNVDPHQAAEVELNVIGIHAKSASGETLTAPKVDSVNTFEAPNTVVPKPISARAQGGKLILQLEPKSVTVVSVEQ
jgi:alpha-N-arabinofuranosidase